ncbi:hypothetical protein B8W97_14460, partial [Staphylococcus haemolyticus]
PEPGIKDRPSNDNFRSSMAAKLPRPSQINDQVPKSEIVWKINLNGFNQLANMPINNANVTGIVMIPKTM